MRWFTADLHLGHKNIITYCGRPFADVDEMNESLVEKWNVVVADDDEVWVLGDLALGNHADMMKVASRLRGNKHLVPGNHDRCWVGNNKTALKQERARFPYEEAGFVVMPSTVNLPEYRMSHFPYITDDRHGNRFADYHPTNYGAWLLHGHVHDLWKVEGRQINVGVDVWDYTPVSEQTIMEIIGGADK